MYNRTNYFCALKLFQYILEEGDRPVWEKMKKGLFSMRSLPSFLMTTKVTKFARKLICQAR